jgi:hypothetical protein
MEAKILPAPVCPRRSYFCWTKGIKHKNKKLALDWKKNSLIQILTLTYLTSPWPCWCDSFQPNLQHGPPLLPFLLIGCTLGSRPPSTHWAAPARILPYLTPLIQEAKQNLPEHLLWIHSFSPSWPWRSVCPIAMSGKGQWMHWFNKT